MHGTKNLNEHKHAHVLFPCAQKYKKMEFLQNTKKYCRLFNNKDVFIKVFKVESLKLKKEKKFRIKLSVEIVTEWFSIIIL